MRTYLITLLFITPFYLYTQNLFPENGVVFQDDVVPRIDIILPTDSLNAILDPNNLESNYHYHADFTFDNGTIQETIENIGFRLRGNTSRNAAKKSFKVSFNTYEPGRKFYGLEKMNLNGEHNDPTVARSKICWDLARKFGVPAPRSNHIALYINGDYFGLYINVEHIDEEFAENRFGNKDGNLYKCLYPADLVYKGEDPDLYKQEYWGRQAYALKTNEEADDYSDLAHFIDVLNNAPIDELPCSLEPIFNVRTFLKSLVLDVLIGNWDGPHYNKNNFYLYKNTRTEQFEFIPYDLDNTLGIDWLNRDWGTRDVYDWGNHGEARPLYFRILEVPTYRAQFSYYLFETLQNHFNTTTLFSEIDALRNLIDEYAEIDPLRPLDYGFTYQHFLDGFEQALNFTQTDYGIKDFITTRRFNAAGQLEPFDIAPIISQVETNHRIENESVEIRTFIEGNNSDLLIEFCYLLDNQSPVICQSMLDDGTQLDGTADDGIFGLILSGIGDATLMDYYIQGTDNSGAMSRYPVCGYQQIFIGSSTITLAVNEFMASNQSTIADEFGEYDDWVEIYNYGDAPVYLGDKHLSDNRDVPDKWLLPDVTLDPEEFLLIWADKDEEQGALHANFKLSTDGEFIGIFDSSLANYLPIDGYAFSEQQADVSFGRLPNGMGDFQPLFPTPGASNLPVSTEVTEQNKLKIVSLPNPFSDELKIQILGDFASEGQISIRNVTGQKMFGILPLSGEVQTFKTAYLPSGIYFLVIEKEGRLLVSEKLVKL